MKTAYVTVNHVGKSSAINYLEGDSLTQPSELRNLVARVVESDCFRRSPRLREFLEFVCELSLDGRAEEICESRIGEVVFQRGAGFSSAEDNIVRATARALRAKLRDYFETEGRDEPVQIEIPKGSYTPRFVPVRLLATKERQHHPPHFSVGRLATLAAFCILIALIVVLYLQNRELARTANPQPAPSLLTAILGERSTLNIVASDTFHHLMQEARGAFTPVEDYASKRIFSSKLPAGMASFPPELWDLVRNRESSDGSDLRSITRISRAIAPSTVIKVHHARNLTLDAFQVGEDFVILGGRRANPWAGIFEKDLNFEMEFPRNFGMASFRNRDPRNGEAARFENRLDSRSTGNAYGRVALVPGLSGKGKVILIAGTNGVTTAAAGELLLQPWALKEIEHRLNRKLSPEISRLELLIETYAIGGGTRDFRIVAIR